MFMVAWVNYRCSELCESENSLFCGLPAASVPCLPESHIFRHLLHVGAIAPLAWLLGSFAPHSAFCSPTRPQAVCIHRYGSASIMCVLSRNAEHPLEPTFGRRCCFLVLGIVFLRLPRSAQFIVLALAPLDFTVHIPSSFFEVFDGVVLQVGPPDVFHGVPKTKIHALSHLYALHAGRMLSVVRRVVHGVNRARTMCCCQRCGA